ncbi:MAG TPA: efflux RND transporter periplasmic adaptor subunit [Novosphingobium sp.]|nr:efflux RND transporter periplasmic adaptor subunit [Novosphingobium sp.]HZV08798.1 efflux RND transporter periplasmic adaptor subunit [Novosphingobium sp.]
MNENIPAATLLQPSRLARRKRALLLLGGVVVVALVGWGAYTLLTGASQTTDDAYVGGNMVQITAREGGIVNAIHADATQTVTAGQPLIDLDGSTVDAQMAAAEAQLAKSVRDVRQGFTRVDAAAAEVAQAQTQLATASSDLARRQAAVKAGAVSGEEAAHAADAARNAGAALTLARARAAEAEASVAGTTIATNPAVLAAIAQIRQIAVARSHLHITAPVDGVVAQRTVQLGQQVGPGTPMMTVVPLQQVWVDANFRETQLADIRIGQPVTLKADAYGSAITFHGKVLGLAPGSGNAFALLPPQNASGNWIKIVQRLPVRIALDRQELADHPLRVGLSVTVDVDTSSHEGKPLVGAPAAAVAQQSQPDVMPAVEERIHRIIADNSTGAAR